MCGKIEVYEDCVSLYSYFAIIYLSQIKPQLQQHGIEIETFPVFLGGIMSKSGNQPPWKLPARNNYLKFDRVRAEKYFASPTLQNPAGFPPNTLLRAATYIKANFEPAKFEAAVIAIIKRAWEAPNVDLSKPDGVREALAGLFSDSEIANILEQANSPETKKKLLETTDVALEKGAFGCPWFWVTNSKGQSEPFFGSDRFHYMWQFLDLPSKDMAILTPEEAVSLSKSKI